MTPSLKALLGALLLSASVITAQAQSVMNNSEVLKLIEAGMPDEVILEAIGAAKSHRFDTSANGLVALKNKGASPAVLKAVLNPKSVTPAAAGVAVPVRVASVGNSKAASESEPAVLNPELVAVVINGQEQVMQYIIPSLRTSARALGFGGVASYAALSGTKATRRLPGNGVEFIVSVPKNAQPQGYLTVANFAVRNNGTREVMTGGGYMSYSTGIHKDRIVAVSQEALADQSRARDGFVLYRVKPEKELAAGEYALVLYTAEVRTAGFFAQAANSYFDFGVD
ncbi:MAG: hypothetical protein ACOVN9_03930 [Inhella sp.]